MNDTNHSVCLTTLQQQMARYKHVLENSTQNQSAVQDAPLNETEEKLFDALKQQYKEHISKETACSSTEADALFENAIAPYGRRKFIDLYVRLYSLQPILVKGIPYTYFCMNAVICLISYVLTGNFIVTLFAAPSIHILQLIYYQYNKERKYNEALEAAMQKSITIEGPVRKPLTKKQEAFLKSRMFHGK